MKKLCFIINNIFSHNITRDVSELIIALRAIAAEVNGKVTAIILGDQLSTLINDLKATSIDEIVFTDSRLFKNYNLDTYLQQIKFMLEELDMDLVVFPNDVIGRELAGGLSIDLNKDVVIGAFDIKVEEEQVQCKKKYIFKQFHCPSYKQK